MGHFDFRGADSFYPGQQKINLLSERAVKIPLIFFTIFAPIVSYLFVRYGDKISDPADIAISLLAVMPMGIQLAGGAPARAWKLYFCFAFCAFTAVTVPFITGSYISVVLLIPAAIFISAFHRAAPGIFKEYGYFEKVPLWRELAMTVILAVVFPILVYSMIKAYGSLPPAVITTREYFLRAVSCLILYTPLFGIMYGITTRRLLAMKFQLIIPIIVNTFVMTFYFLPTTLMNIKSTLTFPLLLITVFVFQMGLSIAFYYCRSVRFIMVFYIVYYLCYKTWGI